MSFSVTTKSYISQYETRHHPSRRHPVLRPRKKEVPQDTARDRRQPPPRRPRARLPRLLPLFRLLARRPRDRRRTGNELRGQRHDTAQGNLLRHGRNRCRLRQDGIRRRTRNHQADDRRRPVRRQAGDASPSLQPRLARTPKVPEPAEGPNHRRATLAGSSATPSPSGSAPKTLEKIFVNKIFSKNRKRDAAKKRYYE